LAFRPDEEVAPSDQKTKDALFGRFLKIDEKVLSGSFFNGEGTRGIDDPRRYDFPSA